MSLVWSHPVSLNLFLAFCVAGLTACGQSRDTGPISLHPENPHYLLWRGEPTVLITSAEHYGAVLNLGFDYKIYLAELEKDGLNNTRIFNGNYREVSDSHGITQNTLAPAKGKFTSPWARSEEPGAADGENKFDLTRWNDAYFTRLKDFMTEASLRGVVVEVVLFCPMYGQSMWEVNPMNAANNVNGIGKVSREELYTLKHDDLTQVQLAMTRKIVEELKDFDNLYYEICNEPYAFDQVPIEFEHRFIDEIVETEKQFPKKHLISQNIANHRAVVVDPHPAVSIFNFHYCVPPDVVDTNYGLNKLIGENETGFRGQTDLVYRTEAWAFMLAGGGLFNHLDYSFSTTQPDGTYSGYASPGGGSPELRQQLGFLKRFLEGFDFIRMKPDNKVIRSVTGGLWHEALSETGQAYALYVYPQLTMPFEGETIAPPGRIETELTVRFPVGSYRVEWIDTKKGQTVATQTIEQTEQDLVLKSPSFENEIAIRVLRL